MVRVTETTRRAQLALFVCMAIVSSVVSARAGERHALVITNQAYLDEVGALARTHEDGRLITAALRKTGFTVVEVRDAGRAAMRQAVATYISKLSNAGPDAAGFFYFSGHGANQTKYGDNYLVPVDAKLTDGAQLPFLGLKLGDVIEAIGATGIAANFVVVDACRNVPFTRGSKSATKGFAPEKERGGLMLAFATEPGDIAVDENVYARALAEELPKVGQPAVLMFREVRRRVLRATGERQFPWTRDGLIDPFYFAEQTTPRAPAFEPLTEVVALNPQDAKKPSETGRGEHVPTGAFRNCELCPEMVAVPAGQVHLKTGVSAEDLEPGDIARFRKPFAIGKHEVTFEQWDACVADGGCDGYRPPDNGWGRGTRPVIHVSFRDALNYAGWLSRKTGQTYALPTVPQWIYAARAGTDTKWWWGNEISKDRANYDYTADGSDEARPVAQRKTVPADRFEPNPWGLKNVHGNVAEFAVLSKRNSAGCAVASTQASSPEQLSCWHPRPMGGAWDSAAEQTTWAPRSSIKEVNDRNDTTGFRVVRVAPE